MLTAPSCTSVISALALSAWLGWWPVEFIFIINLLFINAFYRRIELPGFFYLSVLRRLFQFHLHVVLQTTAGVLMWKIASPTDQLFSYLWASVIPYFFLRLQRQVCWCRPRLERCFEWRLSDLLGVRRNSKKKEMKTKKIMVRQNKKTKK